MVKRYLSGFLAFLLTACSGLSGGPVSDPPEQPEAQENPPLSETGTPARADLPDFGPAPELANEVWLNTGQPLRLADLRGKVVLIDMWTFG